MTQILFADGAEALPVPRGRLIDNVSYFCVPSMNRLHPVNEARAMIPPRATGPLRVLVVDDHHDSTDSLGQLLSLWGHQPLVAYDPATALEVVRASPPDVVLLDLGLPGMSGWELARRLRADPGLKNILLIAVTGLAQPADHEKSRAAGIDCHLVKPVDPELLQQMLAEYAARRARSVG